MTDNGLISGLDVQNINLEGKNALNWDVAGIKLFDTTNIEIADNFLSGVNGHAIWSDTSKGTSVTNNLVQGVGEVLAGSVGNAASAGGTERDNTTGIYIEKTADATVDGNTVNGLDGFDFIAATSYSSGSSSLGQNASSSVATNRTDYWINNDQAGEVGRIQATSNE